MYLIAGRGGRRNKGTTSTPSSSVPAEPITPLSFDDSLRIGEGPSYDDDDGDVGDDPDLLSELEALRTDMGLTAAATTTEPNISTSPVDNNAAEVFEADDKEVDGVQITKDDINDPSLLTELSSFSLSKEESKSTSGKEEEDTSLENLLAQKQELKALALASKRQGNMEQARQYLVKMKEVQMAIQLQQPDKPAPAPVAKPAPETTKPKKEPTVAATSQPNTKVIDDDTSFQAMKDELETQVSTATRLASQFLKSGNKKKAIEFHRLRKQAVADLAAVSSPQANGRSQPPPFSHHEVQWTTSVEQRRDISINELQISIKRMLSDGDLATTLGGTSSEFYIQWEMGWPRDNKESKAYTRTIKYKEFEDSEGGLDIAYVQNVDFVDRQMTRPLLRWLDRGKITFELYKYLGLLWGSQLIGKAQLPLANLRNKSEVTALLEIRAGSSGATGRVSGRPLSGGPVYIDVAASLRLPISNKTEVVSHSEQWIYLETESNEPEGPTNKAAEATMGTDTDNTAAQLDSMETITSNAVLELELQQIPVRINAAKNDKDTVSQLKDIEAAIKLRMSVVAAQVGAGALSMEGYMDNVSSELVQTKKWAIVAKRNGQRDVAVQAMKRIKAMQNELDEMKSAAAQAAADNDE